jgi:D-amino-acid dehydrogenase
MSTLQEKAISSQNIVVIGAGVIGVATAYLLARDGNKVTVVEREEGPGLETSFANGGQLSAGEAAPWAGPGLPLQALKWLGRSDAPFRLRLKADPKQWRWLWQFWRRCNLTAQRDGAVRNAQLALLSRKAMRETLVRQEELSAPLSFDKREDGILRIYGTADEVEHAIREAGLLEPFGVEQRALSAAECVDLEPALASAHQRGKIAGGVFSPADSSGDAYEFTHQLAEAAQAMGVTFLYGETVVKLEREGSRVVGVRTQLRRLGLDQIVVAAGVMSPEIINEIGADLPVHPVKGYSVTLPVADDSSAPKVSITDEAQRIVISRLGNRLRAAGQAEIAGYDRSLEPDRAHSVLTALRTLFPALGEGVEPEFWCGLRPMTPDGCPVIGPVPGTDNLFLNTGHGTLGWTLAMGSADLLSDLIAGRTPKVAPDCFAIDRF